MLNQKEVIYFTIGILLGKLLLSTIFLLLFFIINFFAKNEYLSAFISAFLFFAVRNNQK